jgi:hypothetical protein
VILIDMMNLEVLHVSVVAEGADGTDFLLESGANADRNRFSWHWIDRDGFCEA